MLLVGFHVPAFAPASSDSAAIDVLGELPFPERLPLTGAWFSRSRRSSD